MTKKITTLFLIVLLSALCVVSGMFLLGAPTATPGSEPMATLPPGITKPEGRVISTSPKIVEGRITKLTEEMMCLSVQNVTWEIVLDETGRTIIQKLNAQGIEVVNGTFVNVHYKEEDGKRIATNIMRVESN